MHTLSRTYRLLLGVGLSFALLLPGSALAQAAATTNANRTTDGEVQDVDPPADYVIGPGDVLSILFWRDETLSADVTVRPDGMITLPLVNGIYAVGLTPEQLRVKITEAADDFVENPTVMVRVAEINSRQVFITGLVGASGSYPLMGPMTVMQLIAMAGGLQDFADKDNITIIRQEGDRQLSFRFNYDDIRKRRNLQQNILLKPGDTVIVN
jgi:polysaccharide export outer membrane protein